ncbi:hypothetical protein J6590_075777, partial [Homalodisca vitripennis]
MQPVRSNCCMKLDDLFCLLPAGVVYQSSPVLDLARISVGGLSGCWFMRVDNNIKWECNRTDCKRVTIDPIYSKLDEILSKLSSLATKDELSDGLNLIKQDLQIVSSKIKELEPRLAQVESEIQSIKDNAHAGDQLYEDLISECNDRNRRSRNVIIHRLTEAPTSSSARDVKLHD